MKSVSALRWTLWYRGIATGSFLVGLALFGLGLVTGFGEAATLLFADFPTNVDAAVGQSNPLVTLAFAVVGLLVWQVGKTYALFVTVPPATGRWTARSFDSVTLRGEVVDMLDDRLANMETELETMRRRLRTVDDGKRVTYDDRNASAYEPSTPRPPSSPSNRQDRN